mmetsp:Transcript_7070/g.21565  ORF Transcript_7070/g.21565 Transcript_7070/m.21565 type:complete len:341 (+) Transcript_7070:28-1050(+)
MEGVHDSEPIFPDRAVRVAITGAAGQIGYALLPMICTGKMFGLNQRVSVHLLEIPPAMEALKGVVMELEDCAFPLLEEIVASDDAETAFKGVDVAVLVGAFPRKAGMERRELLSKNGTIFKAQGEVLQTVASQDVKVLVVGNPANTNALILKHFAKEIPPENITAMTRLDLNRARGLVAKKLKKSVNDVENIILWGNHSSTQFPDVSHARVARLDVSVSEALGGEEYLKDEFIPTIQSRGAAIIAARKLSSAMSAANAACDHIRDWLLGTNGRVVSMAVCSDGSYDVPSGIWYSFPVTTSRGGKYTIQKDYSISDFSRKYLQKTADELTQEKDTAMDLFS